jgi:dephospho-CoA kinase
VKKPATQTIDPAASTRDSKASAQPASQGASQRKPARRVVLGLLGGIASGKSTVSALLAKHGRATVIDADAIAKECLEAAAKDGRLVQTLGAWAVTSAGVPDRKAIAKRVFDDAPLLRALERLTHPGVLARIDDAITGHRAGEGTPLLVLDVPLLIETGLDRRCDAIWFVDASDDARFARAGKRNLSRDEVSKRESAQSPLDRKRGRADLVIENDGSLEDLTAEVSAGIRALGL